MHSKWCWEEPVDFISGHAFETVNPVWNVGVPSVLTPPCLGMLSHCTVTSLDDGWSEVEGSLFVFDSLTRANRPFLRQAASKPACLFSHVQFLLGVPCSVIDAHSLYVSTTGLDSEYIQHCFCISCSIRPHGFSEYVTVVKLWVENQQCGDDMFSLNI